MRVDKIRSMETSITPDGPLVWKIIWVVLF